MALRHYPDAPFIAQEPVIGTRVDGLGGWVEEVGFFGDGTDRMFGCTYMPVKQARKGLVVCSALYAEQISSYRREVLLARALTQREYAVQRFHYRGHGHSDGSPADVTFDRLVEDALAACALLQEKAGIATPSFLGTRFGAIVAAAAASRFPGAAFVAWDPVMEAERFFKDGFRASMMSDVKEQAGVHRSTADRIAELRATGTVEVLGYQVDLAVYDSSQGRTLVEELGPEPRPIFLGQIGRQNEPRPEYRRAIEEWTQKGFNVRLEILRQEEISWFLGGERRKQESRQPMSDASVEWLADSIAEATI